jgi:peroxiredoxin Q/BCP
MTDKNAVVLGVSFDTPEDNKAFAEKFSFPYALLSDTTRAMGQKYGAAEFTETAGYAKRIGYIIGPDGKIKAAWPKVDTKTFAQDVLAKL